MIHMHLSPDEFYKLTMREFWCAAYILHEQYAEPDEEVYTADPFFDPDEMSRIKDLKIITERKRRWQAAKSEH